MISLKQLYLTKSLHSSVTKYCYKLIQNNYEHELGGINHNRFFARILTGDQKDNQIYWDQGQGICISMSAQFFYLSFPCEYIFFQFETWMIGNLILTMQTVKKALTGLDMVYLFLCTTKIYGSTLGFPKLFLSFENLSERNGKGFLKLIVLEQALLSGY